MSTRAIRFLAQHQVFFEVIKYAHHEKGAAYAAESTGFPLEKTIKTLVADIGQKGHVLALMPGDRKLDVKKLATCLNVKQTAMSDPETAERLTGYFVGGISPFGVKRRLQAVMHESILSHENVLINGGQRGTMLRMNPLDIAALLECRILDIAC